MPGLQSCALGGSKGAQGRMITGYAECAALYGYVLGYHQGLAAARAEVAAGNAAPPPPLPA